MILRKRTVELLDQHDMQAELRNVVDRVLIIGDLPCSAIATSASQPPVMAVGANRSAALRRLCHRITGRSPALQPRLSL